MTFEETPPENGPTWFKHGEDIFFATIHAFEPSTNKIGSGVWAVGDGKTKKARKGKKGEERKRYYKNAQKCYMCSDGPSDAILPVVDLTYVMAFANYDYYRLKGGLYKNYLLP